MWLEAYNRAFCKPPLSEEEINRLFNSILGREEATEGAVRRVMKRFNVVREVALDYILQHPELLEEGDG